MAYPLLHIQAPAEQCPFMSQAYPQEPQLLLSKPIVSMQVPLQSSPELHSQVPPMQERSPLHELLQEPQ